MQVHACTNKSCSIFLHMFLTRKLWGPGNWCSPRCVPVHSAQWRAWWKSCDKEAAETLSFSQCDPAAKPQPQFPGPINGSTIHFIQTQYYNILFIFINKYLIGRQTKT